MKANPPHLRPPPAPLARHFPVFPGAAAVARALPAAWSVAAAGALLVSGCVSEPVAPPAAPAPAPPLVINTAAPPAPRAEARAEPRDWRDAALAPGVWRWQRDGDSSLASFGLTGRAAALVLRCERSAGQVTVSLPAGAPMPGAPAGAVNMTIITSTLTRPLLASPASGPGAGMLTVALPARDGLLDAMAFSRGRWRIEAEGQPPLTVPNWPEVARVIEDCR